MVAVIPLFIGWHKLGRKVSFSPVEIAKAFDAPLLEYVDCNGEAESMLQEVGKGKIMYGDVGLSAGRPIDELLGGGFGTKGRKRLEFFDAGFVRVPEPGASYHPCYTRDETKEND